MSPRTPQSWGSPPSGPWDLGAPLRTARAPVSGHHGGSQQAGCHHRAILERSLERKGDGNERGITGASCGPPGRLIQPQDTLTPIFPVGSVLLSH